MNQIGTKVNKGFVSNLTNDRKLVNDFDTFFIDQRKHPKSRINVRDCFLDTESAINDIKSTFKKNNPFSTARNVDIQMGACDLGITVLRNNQDIKIYINTFKSLAYSPVGDTSKYKSLERNKISYSFLHGGKGRKIICSESVEHRIEELATECKIYPTCLLPICQVYGFYECLSNLGFPRQNVICDIEAEIKNIELFFRNHLISLWLQFGEVEMKYDPPGISVNLP